MRPSRERPGLANWLEQDELTGALEDTGFGSIRTFIYQASLDAEAVAGVVGSTYFARAVFPVVPPDLAAEALRDAALEVLDKNGIYKLSHGWLFVVARKETR